MSNSVQPHRWQPTRLPRRWDSPGKNTGVGCHFPLQCMKVKSESEVTQSCPTLSDPMDCSLPGSSIHGIFQARVLEWGAIAFSANQWDVLKSAMTAAGTHWPLAKNPCRNNIFFISRTSFLFRKHIICYWIIRIVILSFARMILSDKDTIFSLDYNHTC